MPHCTDGYPWYVGKFVFGFGCLVFLYLGFLKEKEIVCNCSAKRRQWEKGGEKGANRSCICSKCVGSSMRYRCGCRSQASANVDDNRAGEPEWSVVVDRGDCCCPQN